ncbi:ArgS-related anticodon-binding protein NrtL [Streptomyces sp. MB22_4]|uniref:ArgS-related anticodon-binding protein NrtL n=1 Tax=Streptomyces sp. MB22_4 TaxID=3383120 RepID=UPI0039A2E07F
MTPVELSRTVLHAVRRAVDEGELDVVVPERVVVTEPGGGGYGEYATNVALQLARAAGKPPLEVAGILRSRLIAADGVEDVVVTGPGFLNFLLDRRVDPLQALVREIRERGERYGHGDTLAGQVVALRVPYEVRAEVVADAVVRIVATQGGRATVEHGEPAGLRPVPAPEDPAPLGPDAARWALLHPAPHDRPRITADHLLQRESNPLFRVRYAHARVRSLSRNAARLGFTAEPGPLDGDTGPFDADTGPFVPANAPANADPGPFAPAGDDPRLLAPAGDDTALLAPAGEIAFLASASGEFALAPAPADTRPLPPDSAGAASLAPTGDDTVLLGPADEFVLLAPASDAPASDEIALLVPAPADTTPLAPARTTATAVLPASAPSAPPTAAPHPRDTPRRPPAPHTPQGRPRAHSHPHPLQAPLADYPRILAAAATHRAPDRLARHLVTVADAVLPFLTCVLPIGEEKPSAAHRARLALAEAAGTVLAGGLSLLGIDAPEHL